MPGHELSLILKDNCKDLDQLFIHTINQLTVVIHTQISQNLSIFTRYYNEHFIET